MITSAANLRWPEDVEIDDNEGTGLPIASVVRTAKIATIEARAANRLGILSGQSAARVAALFETEARLSLAPASPTQALVNEVLKKKLGP